MSASRTACYFCKMAGDQFHLLQCIGIENKIRASLLKIENENVLIVYIFPLYVVICTDYICSFKLSTVNLLGVILTNM